MNKPKTLLIDGNYILKRVFTAVDADKRSRGTGTKQVASSIVTTIRHLVKSFMPNKVVVFWDQQNSGIMRHRLCKDYKANRKGKSWYSSPLTEAERRHITEESNDTQYHKALTQSIIQHLYIRQCEADGHEADDLIAYYCLNYSELEDIILYTNDFDLMQVASMGALVALERNTIKVDEFTKVYKSHNAESITKLTKVHPKNIALVKAIAGDNSDNIIGMRSASEAKLIKMVPLEKPQTLESVLERISVAHEGKPLQWTFNTVMGLTNPDYAVLKEKFAIKTDKGRVEVFGKEFPLGSASRARLGEMTPVPDLFKKMKYDISSCEPIIQYARILGVIGPNRIKKNFRLANLFEPFINGLGKEAVHEAAEYYLDIKDIGAKYLMPIMANSDFLLPFRYLRFEDRNKNSQYFKTVFFEYCQPFMGANIKYEKELYYENES